MDDNEFVLLLQLLQSEQQAETDFQDNLLACIGLVCYGLEEAQRLRIARQSLQRLYLTQPNLLPNACMNTPWQALYHTQG
jgi:hypothetical protein